MTFLVGRSNAINIAERLGLPSIVVENARKLYGVASAEINEVICILFFYSQSEVSYWYHQIKMHGNTWHLFK